MKPAASQMAACRDGDRFPPPLLLVRRLPARLASLCILGRRSAGPDGTSATRGAAGAAGWTSPWGAIIASNLLEAMPFVMPIPRLASIFHIYHLAESPPLFFRFSYFVFPCLCSLVLGFFPGFVIPIPITLPICDQLSLSNNTTNTQSQQCTPHYSSCRH